LFSAVRKECKGAEPLLVRRNEAPKRNKEGKGGAKPRARDERSATTTGVERRVIAVL